MARIAHHAIVADLSSSDRSSQRRALKRIEAISDDEDYEETEFVRNPKALYQYVDALAVHVQTHRSRKVRLWCTIYLQMIGKATKASIAALCDALKDKNDEIVCGAITALATYGPKAKSALPTLVTKTKHPHCEVRWRVAYAIEQIGYLPPESAQVLVEMLDDEDGHTRASAIRAMEKVLDPTRELKTRLEKMMQDKDEEAAWAATFLLEHWMKS